MKGQLMHSTKMHHFGQMRAEKMALTRIYKRVSYIPLKKCHPCHSAPSAPDTSIETSWLVFISSSLRCRYKNVLFAQMLLGPSTDTLQTGLFKMDYGPGHLLTVSSKLALRPQSGSL
jgi:hypothetical protein